MHLVHVLPLAAALCSLGRCDDVITCYSHHNLTLDDLKTNHIASRLDTITCPASDQCATQVSGDHVELGCSSSYPDSSTFHVGCEDVSESCLCDASRCNGPSPTRTSRSTEDYPIRHQFNANLTLGPVAYREATRGKECYVCVNKLEEECNLKYCGDNVTYCVTKKEGDRTERLCGEQNVNNKAACEIEKGLDGKGDVEVCYCDKDRCNNEGLEKDPSLPKGKDCYFCVDKPGWECAVKHCWNHAQYCETVNHGDWTWRQCGKAGETHSMGCHTVKSIHTIDTEFCLCDQDTCNDQGLVNGFPKSMECSVCVDTPGEECPVKSCKHGVTTCETVWGNNVLTRMCGQFGETRGPGCVRTQSPESGNVSTCRCDHRNNCNERYFYCYVGVLPTGDPSSEGWSNTAPGDNCGKDVYSCVSVKKGDKTEVACGEKFDHTFKKGCNKTTVDSIEVENCICWEYMCNNENTRSRSVSYRLKTWSAVATLIHFIPLVAIPLLA